MSVVAPTLRIFLADDHAVLRQGLRAILQQEGFNIVGEASDGRTAVAMCRTLQPHVAILDVAMPLLNGVDAARELLKECPGTKVILLTMYAEDMFLLSALRAGVAAYVLKSSAASSLLHAIEAVVMNETYLSPAVSRMMVQAYLSNVDCPPDPLSPREREVLQLIAEGNSMKEIGGLLGISARTAETHRARIMAKLNVRDVAGLVRYAVAHGLIIVNAPVS
jgi:two-component system response regulator NreC